MVDIAKYFSKAFFGGLQKEENLAEEVRDLLNEGRSEKYFSKHYSLTELCNPQKAYWNRKFPKAEVPRKLALLWRRGTRLHNFAGRWFRELPDFLDSEATLDGFDVGIPGIIGRIDFKVGSSIIELKTKPKIPETSEEVMSLFPQDLEQLLFYSVMHKKHPLINYLIFMEDTEPHKIKAFKIELHELEPIRELLVSRKDMLDKALESEDPAQLGRCRYYDHNCEMKSSNKCDCQNLKDLPLDVIQRLVEITYDEKMTNDLIECRKKVGIPSELFTTNEIIAPRKSFIKRVLGEDTDYTPNEVLVDRKSSLGTLIYNLGKSPSTDEMKLLENSLKEKRLYIGKKWLKISSSKHPEGIVVPYLIKASDTDNRSLSLFPGQYEIAELAIICAAYGKNEGLIFKIFPNLENSIQVFNINFKDLDNCLKEVRLILDNLEKAQESKKFSDLPPCPFYMNSKKDCPLTGKCHSDGCIGCLIGYRPDKK